MKISNADLFNKYGIKLPVGKYRINTKENTYSINSVKDDTEGCILVGQTIRGTDLIGNSINAFNALFEVLERAYEHTDPISITIINKEPDNV